MSRYLEILSVQRPFEFNVDENKRSMFSLNLEAMAAAPVDKWEEELAQVLIDAGHATLWTGTAGDTFIGSLATIPEGAGPWITILDTGGSEPMDTHNGDKYEKLSAQIVVRASTYAAARTRALAVWRAIEPTRNSTITAA